MKVKNLIEIIVITILISILTIKVCNYYSEQKNTKITGSGGCQLSDLIEAENANKQTYNIYSPLGESTIKLINQAPRLTTLNGKTIAIVGGSFMANITHPEIKRLILENYPSAKVILLNEIGSAGPYPAPGVKRKQKDEFEQNLKALKVDAVISGNGGCGLCTPKEEGSCITAEYIGIPSVMLLSRIFYGFYIFLHFLQIIQNIAFFKVF